MGGSGVVWLEGEKSVVEEGTFEDSVDEEVEGVPDEEDALAAGGLLDGGRGGRIRRK